MESKVFLDGAIATKSWRGLVGKTLLFVLVLMPLFLLCVPAGFIWLVSLGHINFVGIMTKCFESFSEKVFPE